MRILLAVSAVLVLAAPARAGELPSFAAYAQPFLENYCLDCHDADTSKGDVVLDDLKGVSVENAATWKSVWEQVALGEMPPKKKKNQPEGLDRVKFSEWVTTQLAMAMKDKGGFHAHLLPAKGNHLVQKINGHVTIDVTDNQEAKRAMKGLLALQLHQGPPMMIQFKDIYLKKHE